MGPKGKIDKSIAGLEEILGKTSNPLVAELFKNLKDQLASFEQELSYESLCFEKSNVPEVIYSLDGRILKANEKFRQMLGYDDKEVGNLNIFQLYEGPKESRGFIERLMSSSVINNIEHNLSGKDGNNITVLENVRLSVYDGKQVAESSIFDITFKKVIERRITEDYLDVLDYQLILNRSPMAVFRWDAKDGKIGFVSDNIMKFGYSKEEWFSGAMNVNKFIHPDDLTRAITEIITAASEGHNQINREYRAVTKNGEILWILDYTEIRRDVDGKVVEYQGIIQDITERKQAEEELLKLRKAIEFSTEAIFITDKDGTFTYANPGFTNLYGHTKEEIIGKATPRIIKSSTLEPQVYESYWKALLAKQEVRGEIVNRRKDGSLVYVEGTTSPIFDESNGIIGFLGIQHDITKRKEVEEIIKENEIQFRDIIDNLPETVFEINTKGNIIFVNKQVYNLWGYTEKDLTNDFTIFNLFSPSEVKRLKENMQKTMRGEVVDDHQYNFVKKDGTQGYGKIYPVPFYKNDKIAGLRGFMIDKTNERKQEEENFRNVETGKQIRNINHQYLGFLQRISGSCMLIEDLLEGSTYLDKYHEIGDQLLGQVEFMAKTIRAFNDYLSPDPEMSEFTISDVLNRATSAVMANYNDNNVGLNIKIYDDSTIKSYENMFANAIVNLLTNAVDITKERKLWDVTVEINAYKFEDRYLISVKDTAGGIPDNILPNLFIRNYTTRKEGQGLGLNMTRGIIERMGGNIYVHNAYQDEKKVGAEFIIELDAKN